MNNQAIDKMGSIMFKRRTDRQCINFFEVAPPILINTSLKCRFPMNPIILLLVLWSVCKSFLIVLKDSQGIIISMLLIWSKCLVRKINSFLLFCKVLEEVVHHSLDKIIQQLCLFTFTYVFIKSDNVKKLK